MSRAPARRSMPPSVLLAGLLSKGLNEMELHIGAHRIVVDEDIVTIYVQGRLELEENKQLLALLETTYAQFDRVFLITVVGPGFELPPECRKLSAEWGRDHVITCNLVAGAPFAIRTIINLLSRASKLIGAQSPGVEFTATEADARHLIAEHKAQSGRGAKTPHSAAKK